MAKEEIQKEQEIVQDVKNVTPTETQKSPEEFLQQINNISTVPTNTKNVSKQVSVNTDNNSSSNQNSSNSSSVSDNLGVRIVKKNSLDGDVNADLRDPMSSSTQARVIEKNNLVGNVVADLREPTYEHKDEMPKIEHKATTPPPEGLLTLSSVHVNEGSPYALFTVNGKPNEFVSLGLSGQNSDGHNLSSLEYFNGNSWVSYISGNINLDLNGKVLVRVSLSPEQERELDGVETFNLIATNRDGLSATGTGTIHDDGTGSYFASNNNSETSNIPNGVVLDDDRPLIINNVSVNEASTYAVFEITGATEQKASLDLQNGTTTGLNALEYFDGTSWVSYTSGNVNLDSNGKLLVRVILSPEQERIQDNGETFTLTATNTGGTSVIGTGT
jgi:hypothetical protein